MPDAISLIIPSFIAGILTFFAPCTLPLIPAYLGFISGSSVKDLHDSSLHSSVRRKALFNGIFFVFGFSVVFVGLGSVFGIGGSILDQNRFVLVRIGGAFIFLFGLYLTGLLERFPRLHAILSFERRLRLPSAIKHGTPMSGFIFGSTFAFAWTPCVGPILGSVLFLASSTATVWQGAFLLAVFSLGLALPFLFVAIGIGHATQTIRKLKNVLQGVSLAGGVLLMVLGLLLLTDQLRVWLFFGYKFFEVLPFEWLLDYL